MNIAQLLTLLLPTHVPQTGEAPREVLRDFPGCGQLGDPNKQECFWDCDWGPSPLEGLQGDVGTILNGELDDILRFMEAKIESLGMCQELCKVGCKFYASSSLKWKQK